MCRGVETCIDLDHLFVVRQENRFAARRQGCFHFISPIGCISGFNPICIQENSCVVILNLAVRWRWTLFGAESAEVMQQPADGFPSPSVLFPATIMLVAGVY